jgi:hypothetical protein
MVDSNYIDIKAKGNFDARYLKCCMRVCHSIKYLSYARRRHCLLHESKSRVWRLTSPVLREEVGRDLDSSLITLNNYVQLLKNNLFSSSQ